MAWRRYILEILGSKCDAPHSLNSIKQEIVELEPGDSINLSVLRQGQVVELTEQIK